MRLFRSTTNEANKDRSEDVYAAECNDAEATEPSRKRDRA